ncbi:MAG: phosphatase PAP2 family protein [Niabella sp.]
MVHPCYIPLPDWFVNTDHKLFELINVKSANGLFDSLLPLFRNPFIWGPLYLFIVAFAVMNFKKSGWWWFGLAIATAACTDMVGARLFKETFERLRPCSDPEMQGHVRMVLGRCSGGFSFVSNHAINHFGIAAFVYSTFRSFFNYSWALFIWAALISYAQIYVGVHYPFDVLFGALFGIIIGSLTGKLFNKKIGFPIFDK